MKRVFRLSMIIALAVSSAMIGAAQEPPNVVGTWDMTIDSPQGQRKAVLVIRQEGDKLKAAMKGSQGERPLDSAVLKGDEITLVMTIQFQGSDMVITYKGKAEKDSMKGEADFGGFATGEWAAVRQAAAAPSTAAPSTGAPPASAAPAATASASDISGAWALTVESPQGTGTPSVTFKQEGEKLTGNYKGRLGEAPLTGTVKGSDVSFTIKINFQGQDMEMAFTGKLEGKDSMKGAVNFGGLADGTWTAKKQ